MLCYATSCYVNYFHGANSWFLYFNVDIDFYYARQGWHFLWDHSLRWVFRLVYQEHIFVIFRSSGLKICINVHCNNAQSSAQIIYVQGQGHTSRLNVLKLLP